MVMGQRELTLRLVCGLLASSARLVPVPILDDVLREKAIQLMVSRTLKAHGRGYSSTKVESLYGDPRSTMYGCLLWLVLFPIKVILFPIKKLVVWVMAAKYLAMDLSESLLLGRALDQVLGAGRLADGSEGLGAESQLVRNAFDNAVAGTDMKLLRGVLRGTLASVSGLPRAALAALRKLRSRGEGDDPTEGLSKAEREQVDEGAGRIQQALETPEMKELLADFDARFEENLNVLAKRAG